MLVTKAAKRYAMALLETAKAKNAVDQVLKDVLVIKSTIDASRELKLFLKSPLVKPRDKRAVLDAIFKERVSEGTVQFLELVTEKGRESILHDIVVAFTEKYNLYAGIITVEVKSAHPLTDQQKKMLREKLEEVTSKKVELTETVQPELIGGISVQIDDTVYDATIKHKLNQLENRLLAEAVE